MQRVIVYQNDEGGVSIVIPTPECLQNYTVEEIARKDVPANKPYKILDATDIPEDRMFRKAWVIDESELTDGVGAESNEFI